MEILIWIEIDGDDCQGQVNNELYRERVNFSSTRKLKTLAECTYAFEWYYHVGIGMWKLVALMAHGCVF